MGQSKISLKELASIKRKFNDPIDDYLNMFHLLKARCFTQVSEHELVEMVTGGLDYSIKKKLDTQNLRDMTDPLSHTDQKRVFCKMQYSDNGSSRIARIIGFIN